jgi:hypothetical protein
MYIRYPVRNFRCPFCGAKMPTETYEGWKPWKCPGCARELQFSEAYSWIVLLCFFAVALLSLYLLGLRGWQLFVTVVLAGFFLTLVLTGPLHRIAPPRLEPYRPPPWKENKFVTLFPRERVDSDEPKEAGQPGDEPRKDS